MQPSSSSPPPPQQHVSADLPAPDHRQFSNLGLLVHFARLSYLEKIGRVFNISFSAWLLLLVPIGVTRIVQLWKIFEEEFAKDLMYCLSFADNDALKQAEITGAVTLRGQAKIMTNLAVYLEILTLLPYVAYYSFCYLRTSANFQYNPLRAKPSDVEEEHSTSLVQQLLDLLQPELQAELHAFKTSFTQRLSALQLDDVRGQAFRNATASLDLNCLIDEMQVAFGYESLELQRRERFKAVILKHLLSQDSRELDSTLNHLYQTKTLGDFINGLPLIKVFNEILWNRLQELSTNQLRTFIQAKKSSSQPSNVLASVILNGANVKGPAEFRKEVYPPSRIGSTVAVEASERSVQILPVRSLSFLAGALENTDHFLNEVRAYLTFLWQFSLIPGLIIVNEAVKKMGGTLACLFVGYECTAVERFTLSAALIYLWDFVMFFMIECNALALFNYGMLSLLSFRWPNIKKPFENAHHWILEKTHQLQSPGIDLALHRSSALFLTLLPFFAWHAYGEAEDYSQKMKCGSFFDVLGHLQRWYPTQPDCSIGIAALVGPFFMLCYVFCLVYPSYFFQKALVFTGVFLYEKLLPLTSRYGWGDVPRAEEIREVRRRNFFFDTVESKALTFTWIGVVVSNFTGFPLFSSMEIANAILHQGIRFVQELNVQLFCSVAYASSVIDKIMAEFPQVNTTLSDFCANTTLLTQTVSNATEACISNFLSLYVNLTTGIPYPPNKTPSFPIRYENVTQPVIYYRVAYPDLGTFHFKELAGDVAAVFGYPLNTNPSLTTHSDAGFIGNYVFWFELTLFTLYPIGVLLAYSYYIYRQRSALDSSTATSEHGSRESSGSEAGTPPRMGADSRLLQAPSPTHSDAQTVVGFTPSLAYAGLGTDDSTQGGRPPACSSSDASGLRVVHSPSPRSATVRGLDVRGRPIVGAALLKYGFLAPVVEGPDDSPLFAAAARASGDGKDIDPDGNRPSHLAVVPAASM